MFTRVFKSAVIVSVVAFFAIARGVPTSSGNSQCDNGGVQCCEQVLNSTTAEEQSLGGLLGLLGLAGDVGDIGFNCNPIDVLGVGSGANCDQQAVCCTNVNQNGLINWGCSPVDLSL